MTAKEILDTATRQPPLRACPQVRGYPLVGVLPQLLRDAPNQIVRIAQQHPREIVVVSIGPMRVWLVSHPPHVEQVLHTRWRNYGKKKTAPMWRSLRLLLGNGLVASEGTDWVVSRRAMQPIFNHNNLKALTNRMLSTIDRTLDEMEAGMQPGQPIDWSKEMNILTQNVILESVFDVAIDRSETQLLGAMLATALREINLRIFLSFLPERFPLPGEQRLRHALATIDERLLGLSKRWEQASKNDRPSLLGQLRAAVNPETGQGLSAQQIRDELVNLWTAGNESTATIMTWLIYLLDRHPEQQARVRAEIAEVVGDRDPTFEDTEKLRYCRQVILETMRIYPPIWFVPRECLVDDVIDGYPIPAGAQLMITHLAAHSSPLFWDKPEVFDPERFSPERSVGRHPYAFMPFGGGPRRCIGEHFALLEAMLILVRCMQRYQLKMVEGYKVKAVSFITLRPLGQVPMHVQRLSSVSAAAS